MKAIKELYELNNSFYAGRWGLSFNDVGAYIYIYTRGESRQIRITYSALEDASNIIAYVKDKIVRILISEGLIEGDKQ